MEKLDKFFKLSERGGTFKGEFVAGLTTFMAMSYILAVNPMILSTTGMDKAALVTVTGIAAIIGSLLMGFYSNLPIAAAPGMGTNAYFAFIICAGMGLTWQEALSLTFYNGLFFLIISLCGIREKIIKAIPSALQIGLQCGIGLFIALIGLKSADIIVANEATLISMGDIFSSKTLLALFGFALTAFLISKKVRGAIMFVIALLTILGFFICDDSGANLAKLPERILGMPASISQTFFALDFTFPLRDFTRAIPVITTLLLLDMFDTIGTVVALCRRVGFLDAKGNLKGASKALVVDSSATILGATLGTSTVCCYAESAAGIEEGGKTGITAIVVAILFLVALFFSPLIACVPTFATAPALILVGIMMTNGIADIKFKDSAEFVPAIFCMLMIMLSFSITQGFAFGVIMYVVMMASSKRAKEIKLGTWILFLLMLLFIFII